VPSREEILKELEQLPDAKLAKVLAAAREQIEDSPVGPMA
jgi:hypothetical protein